MNDKIKDMIYNKSDILVALLILVVAAAIIIWRLNVILTYPKVLLGTEDAENSEILDYSDAAEYDDDDLDTDATEELDEDPDRIIVPIDEASDTDEEESTQTDSGEKTDDSDSESTELFADGKLTKTVKVQIEGNSATAAVQCLIDAGLFDDYAEYKSICTSNGLNDEKVSAGLFTFKKGCTKTDIAKAVNWS